MKLKTRFWINTTILLVIIIIISAWLIAYDNALNVSQYLSGWLLFGAIAIAGLYTLRKRLSMLPILSNSTWLQVHIYIGFLSIWLFLRHIQWQIPNGFLEVGLSILFALVTLTGVFGLWLTKILPSQLSYRGGEEIIYERIPYYREKIRKEVEDALIELLREEPASSLNKYYCDEMYRFFSKPGNFFVYTFDHARHFNQIKFSIESQERYLNNREKQFVTELKEWAHKKHELDIQYTYQKILKFWLFTHMPIAYGMYVLNIIHIIAVYAFRGGY